MIKCDIYYAETTLHLYQLFTGFQILKNQRRIKVNFYVNSEKLPSNTLRIVINNSINVLYDVNDGYDNLMSLEKYDNFLNQYDYCFKRSYCESINKNLKNGYKIYPLGLNYMVTNKKNIAHVPNKYDLRSEKIKKIIRMIPGLEHSNNNFMIDNFEFNPIINPSPKILFMARLWNPDELNLEKDSYKRDERVYINQVRTECIVALKKEFGSNFIGGLTPNEYSIKNYSDLIYENKSLTTKKEYLKLVKNSDICIATTGLHNSIGWKFAEYVAASKAIISEKLNYQLPGDFIEGINYLEFNNKDECVEAVMRVYNDEDLRFSMMEENKKYYQNYVRPDRLIFNTLITLSIQENILGEIV